MKFKKGFTIKPKAVNSVGEVLFTDGVNEVLANQKVCEAYGYRYNPSKGTCEAFIYNTKLNRNASNVHNITKGTNNTTNAGTENTFVLGRDNTTFGDNKNSIVIGQNNQIEIEVNNAAVITGSFGKALNQSELVLSGGGFGDTVGLSQTSFVQQSGLTTDNTQTNLFTQYITNKFIEKVANAVIGFEANVIGVNYGGEGEVGQYIYLQLTGAVAIGNGFATTYTQSSTIIADGGLEASATMKDATATSFGVAVTGQEGIRIQWTADIRLWQNKITTTF